MRTRNLCIGTVYRDGLLVEYGQLRSRKCLSVNWRGQTSVFQAFQFLDERQLVDAVRGRLAMAGLRLLQVEIKREAGRGDHEPIRCMVGRLYRPHSRAVQVNRMWQSWKLKLSPDEMQEAMAALAIGRKE
jgi:hypothetical protein